jgi:hypothetical protein
LNASTVKQIAKNRLHPMTVMDSMATSVPTRRMKTTSAATMSPVVEKAWFPIPVHYAVLVTRMHRVPIHRPVAPLWTRLPLDTPFLVHLVKSAVSRVNPPLHVWKTVLKSLNQRISVPFPAILVKCVLLMRMEGLVSVATEADRAVSRLNVLLATSATKRVALKQWIPWLEHQLWVARKRDFIVVPVLTKATFVYSRAVLRINKQ